MTANPAGNPAVWQTTLFTVPAKLTERQQLIYDYCRRACDAREAGTLLHLRNDCQHCRPDNPCKYATVNGREILEALRRKGLLRRDRHHVYRRVDSTGGYDPATADFPEGF